MICEKKVSALTCSLTDDQEIHGHNSWNSGEIILRIFYSRVHIRVRKRPSRFSHTGRPVGIGAAETHPDAVPSIHLATRRRMLLGDQPHPGPRQGTQRRAVRVWLRQRHSRFGRDPASITHRHSHNIRNDDEIRMTVPTHGRSMAHRHQHALDFPAASNEP